MLNCTSGQILSETKIPGKNHSNDLPMWHKREAKKKSHLLPAQSKLSHPLPTRKKLVGREKEKASGYYTIVETRFIGLIF